MAKNPYIKPINPTTVDSHQTSAGCMLTVIRFENRDSFNYDGNYLDTRNPLIIYNDVVSLTISNNKGNITSSLSATLLAGDLNYATAISPGDYVFANIVNWETDISVVNSKGQEVGNNTLRKRAASGQPINTYNDGFKGLFKIQKVSKTLTTDPNTGTKAYFFQMQAYGFTELNTTIYYDPQIYAKLQGNFRFFMQQFEGWFDSTVKEENTVQNLMPILINALLGKSRKSNDTKTPNQTVQNFEIPEGVALLLGLSKGTKIASEIYNYYIGIWQSSSGGANQDPSIGFNPSIENTKDLSNNFYTTGLPLQGNRVVEAEYWNNVKVWAILGKYANLLINEMYTTYRVNPNGRIMPSLVIRQKPFTSEHFQKKRDLKTKFEPPNSTQNVTRFMELPRWYLNPSMVYNMNLGKDEAARINFVQIYTRAVSFNDAKNRAAQAGTGNYQFDPDDIKRHGLKPYLATADFDYPENINKSKTKGKEWANLVADWVIGGHLKESGTISCVGIQDPISVGDNIQFNGIIYHIEGVTHTININPQSGKKIFRTNLTVTFGMSPESNVERPVYSEMEHQDTYTDRIDDYNRGERILPGFSDTQNIVGRVQGEEIKETRGGSATFTKGARVKNVSPKSKADGTTDVKDTSKSEGAQDKNNFKPTKD